MTILNFGSINVDLVYTLERMPQPGETLSARAFQQFLGGKGVNQSVAIAASGGQVRHIGAVGPDGDWALGRVEALGVATDHIARVEAATGHAIIFVDPQAENMIVIEGGANQALSLEQIDAALAASQPGDWVLLQNETNLTVEIVQRAKAAGLQVAYSPAPFDAARAMAVLDLVDLLAVNQYEAGELRAARRSAGQQEPVKATLLVTLGSQGAELVTSDGAVLRQPAFAVTPVDTTGAGDTFLGAFLAHYTRDPSQAQAALQYAAAAAALQVQAHGAAVAIPSKQRVEAFLAERAGSG
jgi:ribokinase